jgi:tRNA (guanine37-N1)-methyltransferase
MTLRIDVFTLFPDLVSHYAEGSILGRAAEREVFALVTHDIRSAAVGVHKSVDDSPFGGGAGMVMSAEAIIKAVEAVSDVPRPLIALTPSGRPFSQVVARELAALEGFSLLCGRYEGFDQRALDLVVDDEISLGDFVLAGGEIAALAVIEAVVRLRPGGLGNDESSVEESFSEGLLEYPQYTKPAVVRGQAVPEILRSGDHGRIARWRRAHALRRTMARRPDMMEKRGGVSPVEAKILAEFPEVQG